ncbi:MAG: RNA 2',3'-cyclic phosphodiesterase [Bythopirellula sp.]
MATTRTFIAIEANDSVYAQSLAAIELLRPLTDNVRWVAPDQLHWTLQFLGDVEDTEIYTVCRNVSQVAMGFENFELSGLALRAFPSIEKPRTIWLGAGEGSDTLCALQDHVEGRMADLGFRPDRQRFTPHLTLGRVQRGSHGGAALSAKLADLADFDGGAMEVDEVIIFGSELTRDGPIYHVQGRSALAGGA